MFNTLIDKIVEILEANTLIQEVWNYEVEKFVGDPAVTVTPSANESDYDTTEENVRVYAFTLRVFVNRTADIREKGEADEVMRGAVSSILDDFDKNYTLTGISPPTGYTFINVFAVPSVWGYVNRESEYRVCEILLKCRVSVDLNQIS